MPKILITGSLAYDQLTRYRGVFQDELLSKKSGALSIAFPVTDKRIFFGGCAGNIVYNGRLINENFLLFGMAGKDFSTYEAWLKKNHIDPSLVIRENRDFTSEASVVTDSKGQQMAIFYPGASAWALKHRAKITGTIQHLSKDLLFAHIAPNDRNFMLTCIKTCRAKKIPYFFDPGQAMSLFTPTELHHMTQNAFGLFLNEYELKLLEKHLRSPVKSIAKLCTVMIVTLGAKGSDIYYQNKQIYISSQKPKRIKDPTGCGDAYRAGFFSAIQSQFPKLTPEILERAGNLGTKLAIACLGSVGTQNHRLTDSRLK